MTSCSPIFPLTLALSPPAGRGNTPSPAWAGEGWGEGGASANADIHGWLALLRSSVISLTTAKRGVREQESEGIQYFRSARNRAQTRAQGGVRVHGPRDRGRGVAAK